MDQKIELILKFKILTGDAGKERLYVAMYRRKKKHDYVYNITANKDGELLKLKFDGLETYKSIRLEREWMPSWAIVYIGLKEYSWTGGYPVFCHPDHAEAIFQAYECRQGDIQNTWYEKLGFVPDDSNS